MSSRPLSKYSPGLCEYSGFGLFQGFSCGALFSLVHILISDMFSIDVRRP